MMVGVFNWFIPVVCEYNVKYLNDIRWVRNKVLWFDAPTLFHLDI